MPQDSTHHRSRPPGLDFERHLPAGRTLLSLGCQSQVGEPPEDPQPPQGRQILPRGSSTAVSSPRGSGEGEAARGLGLAPQAEQFSRELDEALMMCGLWGLKSRWNFPMSLLCGLPAPQ